MHISRVAGRHKFGLRELEPALQIVGPEARQIYRFKGRDGNGVLENVIELLDGSSYSLIDDRLSIET